MQKKCWNRTAHSINPAKNEDFWGPKQAFQYDMMWSEKQNTLKVIFDEPMMRSQTIPKTSPEDFAKQSKLVPSRFLWILVVCIIKVPPGKSCFSQRQLPFLARCGTKFRSCRRSSDSLGCLICLCCQKLAKLFFVWDGGGWRSMSAAGSLDTGRGVAFAPSFGL